MSARDSVADDRRDLLAALIAIVGEDGAIVRPAALTTYESDALNAHRTRPLVVVLPTTTEQVQAVVQVCNRFGAPFTPRGSGTGLSGGAVPVADGVVISLARMNRVLAIDPVNAIAVAQPGVINLDISRQVAADGLFFAPDPSSQVVSSIGGNVAENAGGVHCLKYGFTVNHVLGLTLVTPSGSVVRLGGPAPGSPGYDLVGVIVGAEGTLGVVTEVIVRLTRQPEAVAMVLAAFGRVEDAGAAVSDVIRAGIVPAAIELMDRASVEAVEAALRIGYPAGADAVLLLELDGPAREVDADAVAVEAICRARAAIVVQRAADAEERARFWKGRKGGFPAIAKQAPALYLQDCVAPRAVLPDVLRAIERLSRESGLRIATMAHAGDGNLHPVVLYDPSVPGQTALAESVAGQILDICLASGGSITGEHGVGLDKKHYLPKMYTDADMDTMQLLRCSLDPDYRSNPGKLFPTPRLCGERPGPYREHPLVASGVADLF